MDMVCISMNDLDIVLHITAFVALAGTIIVTGWTIAEKLIAKLDSK